MKPAPNVVHPIDVKSIWSFLGLTKYLKRFITNDSTLTYPLLTLSKKNSDLIWTSLCEEAFDTLKERLTRD